MSTTLLTFIINEVLQYGPSVITEIESLFKSGTPALADLQNLRSKIEAESYAQFVPASAIPGNVTPPPVPPPVTPPALITENTPPPAPDDAALPPFTETLATWLALGGSAADYPPAGYAPLVPSTTP